MCFSAVPEWAMTLKDGTTISMPMNTLLSIYLILKLLAYEAKLVNVNLESA